MNTEFAVGVAVTVIGFVGYVAGVTVSYPGRSFSLAALMVGLTLAAVGRTPNAEGES